MLTGCHGQVSALENARNDKQALDGLKTRVTMLNHQHRFTFEEMERGFILKIQAPFPIISLLSIPMLQTLPPPLTLGVKRLLALSLAP